MYKVQELKSRDHLLEATDLKYRLPVCSDTLLVCIAEWATRKESFTWPSTNKGYYCTVQLSSLFVGVPSLWFVFFYAEENKRYYFSVKNVNIIVIRCSPVAYDPT